MEPENKSITSEEQRRLVASMYEFSGPIPHPVILEKYEVIHPGLANRIMNMAESQSEHRKNLETKVILHDRVKSWIGLIFAFIIVIVAFCIGGYLLMHDKSVSGLFLGLTPLAVIVGAFIYQKKDKEE